MKWFNKLLSLITLIALLFLTSCQKQSSKHYVWMGEGKIENNAELEKLFVKLKDAGITGVMYQTALQKYPKVVALAHKHGLELHAWQNMLRRYDNTLLNEHKDWYTISRSGKSTAEDQPYVYYYKWLCPSKQEVRDYLTEFVEDLASVPNIDGVHLDYIRHSDVILPIQLWEKYGLVMDKELAEFDFCYCNDCVDAYKLKTGEDASSLGDSAPDNEKWRQFRYDMVSETVEQLTKAVHAKGIKVTAAVFPTPDIARDLVRQDWSSWNLDAYYPMNYHSFYKESPDWIEAACVEGAMAIDNKKPLYSGIFVPALQNIKDFKTAIQSSKKGGASGVCLFTPYGFSDKHWEALAYEIENW